MSESVEPAPSAAEEELPHCKCGTTRDDKHAVAERDYTMFGELYLMWGGTSIPKRVTFKCVLCGQPFEQTTSPSMCRKYIR
jgi:hypothetical protein